MAIDYVLKLPCEVRRNVPEEKLVALVGHMSLAEFAVAEVRRAQPGIPMERVLSEYTVQLNQVRPDGVAAQMPVTIGQLLALARPLGPYRDHCQSCRANVADRPFGCIGKINYPIRKESEEWLLSRLPADGQSPGLSLLSRFLTEVGIDGRPIDALRSTLCELKQPVVRHWGARADRLQVTSSQMLQMLAFTGDIGPQQAALYTQLLGLAGVLSDPHPPSSNIEQFKTLMCAIVMSGRLNAQIRVTA